MKQKLLLTLLVLMTVVSAKADWERTYTSADDEWSVSGGWGGVGPISGDITISDVNRYITKVEFNYIKNSGVEDVSFTFGGTYATIDASSVTNSQAIVTMNQYVQNLKISMNIIE